MSELLCCSQSFIKCTFCEIDRKELIIDVNPEPSSYIKENTKGDKSNHKNIKIKDKSKQPSKIKFKFNGINEK